MSYGLLLRRVVVGGTMFSQGAQKLLGWLGGRGLRGTAGFFEALGWRMPLAMAFLAGLAETSGVAFALGLLTPLAALGIHACDGRRRGCGNRPRPLLDRPADRLGRQHHRRLVAPP